MELTNEDRQFLYDSRNTEYFKIYNKAVNHMYLIHCAQLTSCKPELLLHAQGVLKGLAMARSLLALGIVPEEK